MNNKNKYFNYINNFIKKNYLNYLNNETTLINIVKYSSNNIFKEYF